MRRIELSRMHLTHYIFYPEFLREDDDPKRRTFLLGQFLFACEIGKRIGNHDMIVVPPFVDGPNYVPFPGDQTENNANCIRMLKELSALPHDTICG